MTTSRLGIVTAFIALGMSAVFLLPRSAAQPTGLRLSSGHPALPEHVGSWEGKDQEITKKEIDTLGVGTEFARKLYPHPTGGTYAFVTIVLSGRDISNSLHRPERCLKAQGWNTLESDSIDVPLEGKGTFPVTRLYNRRMLTNKEGTEIVPVEAYTYYWFVGEHALTANHYARYLTDNKDRLWRGVDQRWAFISITAGIPMQKDPTQQTAARKWVDREVRDFIKDLAPSIHGDGVVYE